MYPTKVIRTPARKKKYTKTTSKARNKTEEIGQAEDIRACIKAEKEKTEQKKFTNTLQPLKERYDTGCRRTRQQRAGGTRLAKEVSVKP